MQQPPQLGPDLSCHHAATPVARAFGSRRMVHTTGTRIAKLIPALISARGIVREGWFAGTFRAAALRRRVNMKRKNGHKVAKANQEGLANLLYQVLETEQGGVLVYRTALGCAVNDELRSEWEGYLKETERHVTIARAMLEQLGLDPDTETPGREVVRHIGKSLVAAMEKARTSSKAEEAQIVAAECVVHAETKDHLNWELVGELAESLKGDAAKVLAEAHDQVEKEEDHHLYHTTGWTRELWIESLGLPAVIPPPEEEKNVETAIGAARAKNAREEML